MMKKHFSLLIIFAVIFSLFSLAAEKSTKELPLEYKKWLEEEVVYIISPVEKNVFLKLDTDREREMFIEAFWKHRDPTPGTPENEFKTEHYRRVNYANRFFARGVPKPGWKTDQGRMYILLGEPTDKERFLGEAQIYNTEVWFYQGLAKYGLPTGFYLVFFQKGGLGEYVLYSPVSDGPQALLTSYFGDQANYLQAFRALRKINPNLARVSLSLIPGESASYGRPTLSSNILIQNINSLPFRQFEDQYARKFLLYKDIVEVDYSANYIDNDSLVRVLKDASGFYFVHYNVEIKKFSVQSYQGRYVTNLKINGNVSDLDGKTIYQYEGAIPFDMNEDQLKQRTYNPFSLYDMFPLVPGDYKISVLIKNEVSKEFTSLEQAITVPEDESLPRMSSLILGYNTEIKDPGTLRPFLLGGKQILCQPSRIFCAHDTLFLCFQLLGLNADSIQTSELRYEILKENEKVLTLTQMVRDYKHSFNINEAFALQDFKPGYYKIEVTLTEGEREILSESEHFEITPLSRIPRPWIYSRKFPPPAHPAYAFILGTQYFNKEKIEEALAQFEKAHQSQPDSVDYSLSLARVLYALNQLEKARELLFPLLDSTPSNYDVYLLLGKIHQSLGEFDQAISIFDKAISHFGINLFLLNALGECYSQLGKTEEALSAWRKSLEIKPEQPDLKEKVDLLEKEKKFP